MNNKTNRHLQLVTTDYVPPAPQPVEQPITRNLAENDKTPVRLTRRGKVAGYLTAAAIAGAIGYEAYPTPEKNKEGVIEVLSGDDEYDVQPGDSLEGILRKKFHPETINQDNPDPQIDQLITLEANAVGPHIYDEHLPEEGIKVTRADQITSYPLNPDKDIRIPTHRDPQ